MSELARLLANVRGGLHLACFRPAPGRFHGSLEQVVLLAGLMLATGFAWELLLTERPHTYEPSGLAVQAAWLFSTLLLAWTASRERPAAGRAEHTAVMLIAAAWVGWIGFACLELAVRHSAWFAGLATEFYWSTVFAIWLCPVYAYVLTRATGLPAARAFALAAVYALLLFRALDAWPSPFMVFTGEEAGPALAEASEPAFDVEGLLHEQRTRVERTVAGLRPERPDVTDLYFVGFGADASQGVFRREVEYVSGLFGRRFDGNGRSLLLINHDETLAQHPIASASNLRDALRGLGRVMDTEDDVLFLYLTGHGSKQHELAVNFPGLPLNWIEPGELAEMLDASGIGWRIVVVSACYSGGYLTPLRGERTLVMTAAAADRTSFGCSDDADLTYFARAYFEQELESGFDFVAAFESARSRLAARETEEDITPSDPQIALGDAMAAKLGALQQRLAAGARIETAEAAHAPGVGPEHVVRELP